MIVVVIMLGIAWLWASAEWKSRANEREKGKQ